MFINFPQSLNKNTPTSFYIILIEIFFVIDIFDLVNCFFGYDANNKLEVFKYLKYGIEKFI